MLNCLLDYIGLKGCDTTSLSGLFINDLAGVELELFDRIANRDQVVFSEVYANVQKRAINRLYTDINAGLTKKRYKLKTASNNLNMGRVLGSDTLAASTDYRGVLFELIEESSDYATSNLKQIWVQSVSVYSTQSLTLTYKIFDLETSTELKTGTSAVVSGWNEIQINEGYFANRIIIVVDCSSFITTSLSTIKLYDAAINNDLKVRGVTSTVADPYTITEGDDSNGVSAKITVKCSYESFICNNKELFAYALLYLIGAELMSEVMYTSRLNQFTLFGSERAAELRTLYYAMYKGGTIDDISHYGELNTIIDALYLDQNDICLDCSHKIRSIQSIP